MLPAWLAKASIADQMLHGELLQQYLNNVTDDKDCLSGIRSLARTAHHELQKQLKADTFDIDPDNVQIHISPRATSGTVTHTLTEFALTHIKDLERAAFKLVSLNATAIPDAMDESYIKSLIRNLKPGVHQQAILSAAFADTHPDAADRRKRFATQLPWQLMHYAHSEKLQERLSETGFDLIRQVMDMPDAIARAAVDGAKAIIRPLEFIGIKSGQTIKVPGLYLIGSAPDSAGPQVLLAPYSPRHGVKEYENEQQLLTEMKTRGALHDWVLMNLPQPDRILLETRMATTSNHLSEVTLASTPIKGNLFRHLFNDNAELLARLLGSQSDNNAQGEWATIRHVSSEDLHQAYTFFMGKLAYPITVWRSYKDIKQSAEDLQTHKWGAAIRAFISGIAQLATLRQSMVDQATLSSTVSEPAPVTADTRSKWQDIDITAPERTHLQRYESPDVDLGSLTPNPTLGLYTHPTTKKHYGPIEGKVYPLEKRGARWRIGGDDAHGPYLRQNTAKQWVLDLEALAPRYSMLNRLETALAVRGGMNVEANGMAEIRLLFPVKARLIEEGLDLATTYAWNAFRNLQLLKTPGKKVTPVHQLILEFLDVPTVLPEHVTMLENVAGNIFGALLDPTLRETRSERFVVGRVHEDRETTFAFTIPSDRKRKVYLAEKFFLPYLDHYRNYMSDASFPIRPHARASTLIHELSHIVCDTEDLGYLDASRPFADLIETSSTRARALKKALTDVQRTALSSKSPLTQLFTYHNADSGLWEDFGSTTNGSTDRELETVLRLTGETTLVEARKRFMKDSTTRLAVQLGNADSVSWLIGQLGRQLHTSIP
jgi:hypothetical protein